jgi:hypothetical protein
MEPSDKYAYEDLIKNRVGLPGQYDPFCALVYAVDSILPIVSLGQRDGWHQRAPPTIAVQTTAAQTMQLRKLKSTDHYMASSARRALR